MTEAEGTVPWVYLAPDDSASGMLECSLGPGRTVVWADVRDLVYRGFGPLDDLVEFVAQRDHGRAGLFENDPSLHDNRDGLQALEVARLEELAELFAGVIALRVGVGEHPADRLALAFALALLRRSQPDDADEVMVQRLRADLVPPHGIAGAAPTSLVADPDAWVTVANPERASLRALWEAAVAPDPSARNALVHGGGDNAATSRILARRHPHHETGLSVWDRRILDVLAQDPADLGDLFRRLGPWRQADDPGSLEYFMLRLRHLAGGAALVHATGTIGHISPQPTLTLTTLGRAVLRVEATALDAPHDDRVGGLPVSDPAGLWVRDEAANVVLR